MRILAFLLCLVILPAWAETLYLRAASLCPNNGNGTAYACAATVGGVGAWNTSSNANVVWGSGAGKVSAGDTLYVCGSAVNFSIIPTISGSSGNRWKISGLCPGETNLGYLQGGPSNNFSIDIELNKSYYTIEDLRLGWAKRDSLYMGVVDAGGADATDITIQRVEAENKLATTTTNVCHTIYLNKVPGGLYAANNFLLQDIKVTGTSQACANGNNDGINLEALGTGAIVRRIDSSGSHEGLDVSGGISPQFYQIYSHDNFYSGIKWHGLMSCMSGLRAWGIVVADNAVNGVIWQDVVNGYLSQSDIKHAGTLHGLDIESVNTHSGACVTGENTYLNNYISADYNAGAARIYDTTKADFEANNTWNGNVLRQAGSQTTLIYWSDEVGRTNDVTTSNFSSWQATHTKDQQQVAPVWAAGSAPKTLQGFRRLSTDTLKCAGVSQNRVTDALGRGIEPNCAPIGAMVYGRGDPRTTALTPRP